MEISRVHHDFNDPKLDDAVFWMFLKEMKNCQVFYGHQMGKWMRFHRSGTLCSDLCLEMGSNFSHSLVDIQIVQVKGLPPSKNPRPCAEFLGVLLRGLLFSSLLAAFGGSPQLFAAPSRRGFDCWVMMGMHN